MYSGLAAIVAIELLSNRHFYHMINYLGLSGGTAWYRTKLLEVMLSHLDEYWLFGIGLGNVDHWITEIGGQANLDIVNHFLLIAFLSGITATILYITIHFLAIWRAYKTYCKMQGSPEKEIVFGFIAILVASDITSLSVGIYGPALIISNIVLGIVASFSQSNRFGQNVKAIKHPQ